MGTNSNIMLMHKVVSFKKDGRLHFSIPTSPELEADIRLSIKKQYVPLGKEFFFKRGILDAARACQTGQPRKYGTPMLEVKCPFTGNIQTVTCQEAKELLESGGNYLIRQIGGSKLPSNYFDEYAH